MLVTVTGVLVCSKVLRTRGVPPVIEKANRYGGETARLQAAAPGSAASRSVSVAQRKVNLMD